ncbi:Rho-related GTP-binding protein RhoU [Toxocara canis]|uniref:Rho-related GTP-binding protein RhoU n=1 Tax=Toxocara canis TaxID=6265 RepID=A0A0B2VL72_TOXCA|nr:Rho-related GTP-binding protein RhoU [Toxocara canis]
MVGVRIDPVEEEARVLKCVLVGDAAVGKTSLIVSYTTNGYPQDYVPTAFDNYSVLVRVDNQPIRLQLCDTAGQAEFDSLRPFSYPDTDVFLLCFNVMLPSTLRSITEHWLPEISKSSPNTPIIIVGTQSDLRSNIRFVIELCKKGEQPVSESKARMLAEELSADYIECSALTQLNLKQVFDAAILAALRGKSQLSLQRFCPKEDKKSKIREGFRRIVTFTKRLI